MWTRDQRSSQRGPSKGLVADVNNPSRPAGAPKTTSFSSDDSKIYCIAVRTIPHPAGCPFSSLISAQTYTYHRLTSCGISQRKSYPRHESKFSARTMELRRASKCRIRSGSESRGHEWTASIRCCQHELLCFDGLRSNARHPKGCCRASTALAKRNT